MNLKQARFISIAVTETVVKVSQITNGGLVEKIAKQNIEKGAVDAALRRVLTGFDTKKSAILWVLPGDVATVKNLEVPSTDNEEIESILALQATRHTPFNKNEILISYVRIGVPKPNFTKVLLIVVKRDTVKEKLLVLKSASLPMDSVLFVPEAIARFYAQALKVKKTDAPFAILDVNMQSANFIVQSQGTIVTSRSIPVGIEHLAIDPDASKQIVDEVKASLDAYEHENIDRKPSRIHLSANHMALGNLAAALSEATGISSDTLAYNVYVKGPKAVKDSLAKDFADESALDIIAAGMTAARCQAELIPQEIRDQRQVAEKGTETLKAGILIFCILIFAGLAVFSKVQFKDQFFRQNLVEKYSSQRQAVQHLETMIARTKVLREYLETRMLPLEAMRELYRITPEEIYLTGVGMDDAGMLTISGVSDSMSKVFNFVTALESSPLFENVKTKSTATKKDRGKDAAVFEIVMKLSQAK